MLLFLVFLLEKKNGAAYRCTWFDIVIYICSSATGDVAQVSIKNFCKNQLEKEVIYLKNFCWDLIASFDYSNPRNTYNISHFLFISFFCFFIIPTHIFLPLSLSWFQIFCWYILDFRQFLIHQFEVFVLLYSITYIVFLSVTLEFQYLVFSIFLSF